ncbi:MAG: heme ABC exporter ATP-binding protein CcmA [bacterium]|nr:heme ABC exporter ATP-binding protein CcmA [bacterium]
MPLIETIALTKRYNLTPVLRKLNLTVEKGEFVALLGHNGSGKSTLMRLLCGLSKPTAGVIRVGGWELPKEAAAVRAQIGVVSHKVLLYDTLTAAENLRFFGRLYNLQVDHALIERSLKAVGLARRGDDLVRGFSRGMQQRLSIARALLHQPQVLIFDEPYTGLDQDGAAALDGLLQSAHAQGHTILMATHDLERAAALAERAVILTKGQIGHDAPLAGIDGAALADTYRTVSGIAAGG